MLVAIFHFAGAAVAVIAFGLFTLWLAAWDGGRVHKLELEYFSIRLGMAVDDLVEKEQQLAPEIFQMQAERFSDELFRNRLSDFAGIVRTGWMWLGTAIQVIVFCTVVFNAFAEGAHNAVFAWSVVAISIFFWVASYAFSWVCRILTGRYPGQAKAVRKAIAEHHRLNREAKENERFETGLIE